MISRQVGEHFDHRFGHLLAGGDQIFDQSDLSQQLQNVGIVCERFEIEDRADRRAKQQVLRHRRVEIEPLGIVSLDKVGNPVLGKPASKCLPGLKQLHGRFGLNLRIQSPTQAQGINRLIKIETDEHLSHAPGQRVHILNPRGFVIDPVGMNIEIDIPRTLSFVGLPGSACERYPGVIGRSHRNVTKTEQQIVAQSPGEQVRRRADISNPAPDHRRRKLRQVETANCDPPTGRRNQPGEQQGEFVLAAAALSDDSDVLGKRNREADPIENAAAVLLGKRQIDDRDFAGKGCRSLRLRHLQTGVDHSGGLKLFYDLLVFDTRILFDLIEIEQFFPGRGQILVCRQDRN